MDQPLKIGTTGTFISDIRKFRHMAEIPAAAALSWVQAVLPDCVLGNGYAAKNVTFGTGQLSDVTANGWLNKLFVVVAEEHDRIVAVYRNDEVFHIYMGAEVLDGGTPPAQVIRPGDEIYTHGE